MKNLNTNKKCDDGVEITYDVRVHVLPHVIASCSVLQIKDYSNSFCSPRTGSSCSRCHAGRPAIPRYVYYELVATRKGHVPERGTSRHTCILSSADGWGSNWKFKKKPVEFGEFHQKSPVSGQSEFSKGDKN
jgi:hypothetical protein